MACGQGGHITFELVAMVLLFPLGGENVEISRLLKKAEIARRDSRRKNSFKLTTARKLILHLNQNPNIIWRQDIQHRWIEVLWAKEQGGEGYDKECKPEAENQKAGGWGVQLWGPKAPGPKDHRGSLVGPLWASSIPKSAELIRGMKRLLAGVRGDRGHRG